MARIHEKADFSREAASRATTRPQTMLNALCAANCQQGGTIHQFLYPNDWRNVDAMQRAFNDFTRMGILFSSRASLDKLARQYHVTIHWNA